MAPLDFSAAFLGWVSISWWVLENIYPSWGAPVVSGARCCGPAGSAPLYYASQWEHHRKVSVTKLWCLQREGIAPVSPLTLIQHTTKGTCPLCKTSRGVSHTVQGWTGLVAGQKYLSKFVSVGQQASSHIQSLIYSISSLSRLVPRLISP